MNKQFCDFCEKDLTSNVLLSQTEVDTFAIEGQDSYHFHLMAVGNLLCPDCFQRLLLDSMNLVQEATPEAEAQAEEAAELADMGSEEAEQPAAPQKN